MCCHRTVDKRSTELFFWRRGASKTTVRITSHLRTGGPISACVDVVEPMEDFANALGLLRSVVDALGATNSESEALSTVLSLVGRAIGADVGAVWRFDRDTGMFRCVEFWRATPSSLTPFEQQTKERTIPGGVDLPERVFETGATVHIANLSTSNIGRLRAAAADGMKAALAFPIGVGADLQGVVELFSRSPRALRDEATRMMDIIGGQLGLFVRSADAKNAAALAEARKAAILEAALDCFVTVDAAGRILEINPAGERVFGQRRCDLLGKELAEVGISPSRRVLLRDLLHSWSDRTDDEDAPPPSERRIELKALRGDGLEFPISVTVKRVHTLGPAMYTLYVRDLTDLHRTGNLLRLGERRLRGLLNFTKGIVFEFDQDCRYISVETEDDALLALPKSFMIGKTINEILGEERAKPFNDCIAAVHATGEPQSFEYSLEVMGGTVWFLADAFLAASEPGTPPTVVFHTHDITRRKRAQLRVEVTSEIESAILTGRPARDIEEAFVRPLRDFIPFTSSRIDFLDPPVVQSEDDEPVDIEIADDLATMRTETADDADRADQAPHALRSCMTIPLVVQTQWIGNLRLGSEKPSVFTREHVNIVREVSRQLALGVHQARLNEQLRQLSQRVSTVQDEQRQHIARELGDEIAPLLAKLEAMLEAIPDAHAGRANASIEEALVVVRDLTTQVFALSADLRPAILDEGLEAALKSHFEQDLVGTLTVDFECEGLGDRRLSPSVETATYRIVQEAITNVRKHASIARVKIRVAWQPHALTLYVEDRGVGFDAAATIAARTTGGLARMRERAALLGGRLVVDSSRKRGTRLWAEFPLSHA